MYPHKVQNFVTVWLMIVMLFLNSNLFSQPLKNLDVMHLTCQELFDFNLPDSIVRVSNKNILLFNEPVKEFSWIFEQALVQWLQQEGSRNIYVSHSPDSLKSSLTFTLKPVDLWVSYQKIENGFQRTVSAHTFLSIYDEEQRILLAKQINHAAVDTLTSPDLVSIENLRLEFTQAIIPPSSRWMKIWEPAMVFVTTLGIIYLFYSFRSQ